MAEGGLPSISSILLLIETKELRTAQETLLVGIRTLRLYFGHRAPSLVECPTSYDSVSGAKRMLGTAIVSWVRRP